MRLIALALAGLLASTPAAAQVWKEYAYPHHSITLAFPTDPKIETIRYQTIEGRAVDAQVYSVTQESGVLRLIVADFSRSALNENAVTEDAIKRLKEGGDVKLDIVHRISQLYGRQLSIAGRDGSHSFIAVFFHKKRLYLLEGKAASSNTTSEAIRFQQSLSFTDGG